jgi:hypothetical protein
MLSQSAAQDGGDRKSTPSLPSASIFDARNVSLFPDRLVHTIYRRKFCAGCTEFDHFDQRFVDCLFRWDTKRLSKYKLSAFE